MSKKFTYVFVIAIGIGSLVAGISLCVTKNKPGNELYGRDLTTIAKNEKIVDNINILLDPVMYTEENGSVRSQVYVIPEFSLTFIKFGITGHRLNTLDLRNSSDMPFVI